MGENCVENGRECQNLWKKPSDVDPYPCKTCPRSSRMVDQFEPEPKRIPVEFEVKEFHGHPGCVHITNELYRAIKQAHPKGYIEVP